MWEGAALCGTLSLMAAQGIAASACGIPVGIPTPAFVRAHPTLLCIAAAGLLADLWLLTPIRFGRTAFYAARAAVNLPFVRAESSVTPARRMRRAGRYRRIVAGRLLFWGWNAFGVLLWLTTPVAALCLSADLPSAAAPYPFLLAALGWISAVTGAALWVTWSLRLSPLTILLAAYPDLRVRDAARAAFAATRGRTVWLIRRTVGFFGWFFTCAAVVPLAYVQPMYATARAEWLLSAVHEQAKENSSCKADALYMRNRFRRKGGLI